MDSQFPAEDESLHGLYPNLDDILESSLKADKEIFEDLFIDVPLQPFISRHSFDANNDLCTIEYVKGNEDTLEPSIQSLDKEYPFMFRKQSQELEVPNKNELTSDQGL